MVPLNRSMFIDYGDQKESFGQPQQFTFGYILLAAPISSPGAGADLTASQRVWFPAGEVWYDYFTHEMKQGGHTADISKPLDEFPLYVRGGWVLPMQPYTPRPASAPLDTLVMRVYPAAKDVDNTFTLYEDDGISLDYQKGGYATTPLRYTQSGNKAIVSVEPVEGGYPGLVKRRAYRLQLPAFQSGAKVKVNGKIVKPSYDDTVGCHVVSVPAMPLSRRITIEYDK